jgi:hypothetical protein
MRFDNFSFGSLRIDDCTWLCLRGEDVGRLIAFPAIPGEACPKSRFARITALPSVYAN